MDEASGDPGGQPPEPSDRAELVDSLKDRLDPPGPHAERGHGDVSGVLVPMRVRAGKVELVFTRRTEHLSSHPGEISFPGGRLEEGDDDPLDAALRETHEEVGIPAEQVSVVGHLADYQPFRGPLICAYVGVLADQAPGPHRASPNEVAEVLVLPLDTLLSPGDHGVQEGWAARDYEARVWWDEDKGDRLVHYWQLDEDTRIWGITGELLARFLEQGYGWEPPAAPRRIGGLEEFLE